MPLSWGTSWGGAIPSAVTLSLTDLADGTGMTATVSGFDAGATVTLYTLRLDLGGHGQPSTWTNSGSRTGDGSVTLSLTPSYYWVYATGLAGGAVAVSTPVQQVASRASLSEWDYIIDAVVARVQGLSLTGLTTPPGNLTSASIEKVELIDSAIMAAKIFPRIFVAQNGAEDYPGTTTGTDDIGYPVLIAIIDRAPPEELPRHRTYRKWRQQIRRSLISQRLTGCRQMWYAKMESAPASRWTPDGYAHFISTIAMRFVNREPRGV